MFNLAVPSISSAFSLTTSQVSWIMAGYTIILAIGAGVYSKLTGSFSFKFLYTIGLILFTAGSIVGFFSTTFTQVIIGRLIQATGAAAISPLSYGIVTRFFHAGYGHGNFYTCLPFGGAFGPALTGRLIDLNMSYGMVYISLAAIGLLSFLLTFPVRETNDKVDNSAAYSKKK